MEGNHHSPPCVLDTGEPSLRSPCRYDGCVSNGPLTLPYPKGKGSLLLLVPKLLLSPLYTSPSESKYSVRGIRVIPSLQEKEVSRKARKGAKKSDFLCAFASLRLCVKLALWNCRIFMCTDKYHHTCVYDEISCLVIGFLKLLHVQYLI